jgi:hypothetical protein
MEIINTIKGQTTTTIQDLYKLSWRASRSGCMHYLYDNNNIKVLTCYSWGDLLKQTEKLMR